MDTSTRTFRQEVGKRIKKERERTGLIQKDFAKAVGVANQTYNNLENGIGSLKIEHLQKIAEYCGCDMSYLLGEIDNRTHKATDICKATGLSEEAVNILIQANSGNGDSFIQWFDELGKESQNKTLVNMQNEEDQIFLKIVDSIITNYIQSLKTPYIERKNIITNKHFPINLMVDYGVEIYRGKIFENTKLFRIISEAYNEVLKGTIEFYASEGFEIDEEYAYYHISSSDIEDKIKAKGLIPDDNKRYPIEYCVSRFYDYLRFNNERKKTLRMDIQEAFSDYMKSDFFEGGLNGK